MLMPSKPIDCCDSAKGKCISLTDCLAYRGALNNRLVIVEGKVTTLEEDVDDLQGRMTTVEGKVTTIEGKYVTTDTAQTISGKKTFNNEIVSTGSITTNAHNAIIMNSPDFTTGTPPSNNTDSGILYRSASGTTNHGYVSFETDTSGKGRLYIAVRDANGYNTTRCVMTLNTDSTPYITIPTPGVSSVDNSVVNIAYVSDTGGNLNNLVHTNGDETITGTKRFVSGIQIKNNKHKLYAIDEGANGKTALSSFSPDGNTEVVLYTIANDDGTAQIIISKWRNGIFTGSSTIATI